MGSEKRLEPASDKSYLLETALKEISDIVNSIEDTPKVMDEVVRLTTTILQVGNCSLLLIEPETDELRIRAAFGMSPEIIKNYRTRIGEGITGWVAKTGEPLLIEDVEKHPLFRRKSRARYSTKSLLSVPLIYQKKVVGVLNVNNRKDGGVFTKSDELLLSTLANFIVIALEKSWTREKLIVAERQEADLRVARGIQEQLLPAHLPSREKWEFAARNVAARWVAGDFFDAIPLPDQRTLVVMGDVCGKGVPAALYMARVMACCRVACRIRRTAAEVLSFVNDLLATEWPDETFVTALACAFDNRGGKITFCSAGHPMPFRLRESTGEVSVIEAAYALPLGIENGTPYENFEVEVQPGDAFVLYTDGVTDATNSDGEMFREQRLREALHGHRGPADALAKRIMDSVAEFAGHEPQRDDLTLVVIRHG